MKRIILYIIVIFTAAALYGGYIAIKNEKDSPVPDKADVSDTIPVIVWDKSCSYKNTLSCADIIAPVLFRMNSGGNFDELSSKEFTDSVNCEIWGVFTNSFDPDMTREIMQDGEKRGNLCDNVVSLCELYDIEGANIDFENMYSDDSGLFTEFIKELSEKLHRKGKILSVDVTKINRGSKFYSMCYNRSEISKYADFVILMGYDQYPRTSPVPGPVSGLDWTEEAISDMLSEVPTEKFMLGIPFYTRLWQTNSGEVVSSSAISMDESENLKNQNGGTSVTDECGLDYFEFENENGNFCVWQENTSSLIKRTELAKKYNLSGIACWCLGFESREADEILCGI